MIKEIDSKIGLYVVLDKNDKTEDFINSVSITLGNEILIPGHFTSLSGFFKHSIMYAGLLKKEDKQIAAFYIGDDADLFEENRFYDCYCIVSENRMFNKYSSQSGRDYNFINGKWK